MSFPKIFGYGIKFSTYIEQKPSVPLVTVPRIQKVGLGADRSVHRCVQASFFSAARGWIGDGFLCFRDGDKKMPKGDKI